MSMSFEKADTLSVWRRAKQPRVIQMQTFHSVPLPSQGGHLMKDLTFTGLNRLISLLMPHLVKSIARTIALHHKDFFHTIPLLSLTILVIYLTPPHFHINTKTAHQNNGFCQDQTTPLIHTNHTEICQVPCYWKSTILEVSVESICLSHPLLCSVKTACPQALQVPALHLKFTGWPQVKCLIHC